MGAQRLAVARASPFALCALLAACSGPKGAPSPASSNSDPSARAFRSAVEVGALRELTACSRLVFGPEGTLFTSDSENVLAVGWSLEAEPDSIDFVELLHLQSVNVDRALPLAVSTGAKPTATALLVVGEPLLRKKTARFSAGYRGVVAAEVPTWREQRRVRVRRPGESNRHLCAEFDLGSDRDGDGQRDLVVVLRLTGAEPQLSLSWLSTATWNFVGAVPLPLDPRAEILGVFARYDLDGDGANESVVTAREPSARAPELLVLSGANGALLARLAAPFDAPSDFGVDVVGARGVDGEPLLLVGAPRARSDYGSGRVLAYDCRTWTPTVFVEEPDEPDFGRALALVELEDGSTPWLVIGAPTRDPQRAGSVHWLELASGHRLADVSPHSAASSFGRELAVCTASDAHGAEHVVLAVADEWYGSGVVARAAGQRGAVWFFRPIVAALTAR
jgi:hypothetical protein